MGLGSRARIIAAVARSLNTNPSCPVALYSPATHDCFPDDYAPMTDSSPTSDDAPQSLSTPQAPSGPFSPSPPPPSDAFDLSHTPAVKGRNRASSISFDLGPFKALLRSLQADHDQLERRRSDGADDYDGEEGRGDANPWEKGFDKEEVRSSLAELLLHVEGLVRKLRFWAGAVAPEQRGGG